VQHGVSGWVVPPRDPPALGRAILELARDPEQRRRVGDAARARVGDAFSLNGCVVRYQRLYELVANGRAGAVGEALAPVGV
jgi:glycosyltransferase involved in cell wall biosynthesis